MSDATNDTTRCTGDWRKPLVPCPDFVRWFNEHRDEKDGPFGSVYWAQHTAWHARDSEVEALLIDLDRLAGPPCDYPPCKGRRAVEHAEKFSYVAWKAYVDLKPTGHAVVVDGQPQTHPDWPEGEAWLRARSAK